MIAWLVYRKKDAKNNASYIDWFIKEAEKQQIHLKLIYREDLFIGIDGQGFALSIHLRQKETPDFVIMRVIEPLLQRCLTAMHIPVFNNAHTAAVSNHKAHTYLEMHLLNIPVQPTYFLSKTALPARPPLPFPFVLKEATGRGGNGVFFVTDKTDWNQAVTKLKANDFLVQSAENIQLGKDVRVFVIGKEIVAAVLRENKHDFRANFTLGGSATLFDLTCKMRKQVGKITSHFDFGLVGIDFLLNEQGEFVFNEIEDVVGSRTLSETADINLLERYVTFIKEKAVSGNSRHESG